MVGRAKTPSRVQTPHCESSLYLAKFVTRLLGGDRRECDWNYINSRLRVRLPPAAWRDAT
jgi:hypothetical protein